MKIDKRNKKSPNATIDNSNIKIIVYGLLILLIIAPLWKGLFVESDQIIVNTLVSTLFLYLLFKKESLTLTVVGALLGVFVMANFITIITAANKWLAIQSALNYLALYMVFFMASRTTQTDENTEKFLGAMYISGLLVAVSGILSAFDFFPLLGNTFISGRISSTFQYANTTAIYLGMIVLYGIDKQLISHGRKASLYAIANFIIFVCLFGTQSRGGIIVSSFIYLIYLLFKNNSKMHLAIIITSHLIVAGLCSAIMLSMINLGNLLLAAIAVIFGAGVNFLLGFAFGKANYNSPKTKKALAGVLLLFSLFGAFGVKYVMYDLGMFTRFLNMNLSEINISSRLAFYKDAIALFLKSPIIGWGGGGWQAAYKTVRTLPYYTSQSHNNLLEIIIESGIIGLATFLIPTIIIAVTAYKRRTEKSVLIYGLILLGIFLHGLMDFDFSYGSIGIVYWLILGTLNKYAAGTINIDIKKPLLGVSMISLLLLSSLNLSIYYNDKITEAQKAGRKDLMLTYSLKAERLNPFAEKTKMNIANIYFHDYTKNNNEEYLNTALDYIDKAIALDRFQPDWYATKANYMAIAGNERAAEYYKKAINVSKLDPSEYSDAANVELMLARSAILKDNEAEAAKNHLYEAINILEMAKEVEKQVPRDYPWRNNKPSEDPKLSRTLGYVYVYLNDFETAELYFKYAEGHNTEPMEWAKVLLRDRNAQSDKKEINELLDEARTIIEAVKKV